MPKLNPLSWYIHLLLAGGWALNCLYALACVLGPLIASGLSETQKSYQSLLINSLLAGVVIPPIIYGILLLKENSGQLKWLSLLPVIILAVSVFFTFRIFGSADPKTLTLKVGEEKTTQGLTIKLTNVGHESATSSPDAPPVTYAVYFFELKADGKTGQLSSPAQSLSEAWENHFIKVEKENADHSEVVVRIEKKAI
jgi:hypothetical protein